MKQKKTDGTEISAEFSERDVRLLKQLQQHPELRARFQSILDLAHPATGPPKTADEVEALLIQELRQLGQASINESATQAEVRVADEFKQQDGTLRSRKKKALDQWQATQRQLEPRPPVTLPRYPNIDAFALTYWIDWNVPG
jgi:hypothetical protein